MIRLAVNNPILYQELSDIVRLFFGTEELINVSDKDSSYDIFINATSTKDKWLVE